MAIDESELPDRREDCPFMDDLLHLFEDRGALLLVEFGGLLLEQLIEVGVAAISIAAALDRHGLDPGRRVAEGAAAAHDQVLVLLLSIALEEGGAFERLQARVDADLAEIVDDRLAEIGVRGITIKLAGVEAFGMPRFGQ